MTVGKVCIARRGSVLSVSEKFSYLRKTLAGHDSLAGSRMPKVAQAQERTKVRLPSGSPSYGRCASRMRICGRLVK